MFYYKICILLKVWIARSVVPLALWYGTATLM
jgi:hypothetical protein